MNATVTGLPDLTAVLDAIDLQLTADSEHHEHVEPVCSACHHEREVVRNG